MKGVQRKKLEKPVVYIIRDEVEGLGLKIVEGNKLERTSSNNLSFESSSVKRNLLVDFGEFVHTCQMLI